MAATRRMRGLAQPLAAAHSIRHCNFSQKIVPVDLAMHDVSYFKTQETHTRQLPTLH